MLVILICVWLGWLVALPGMGCFCTKGRKRCRIKCLNLLYCTMWEAGQYWTLEKPYFPWSTKNYQEFSVRGRAVSFPERWKALSFLAGNLESSELLSSLASYVLNDKLRAKCVTEIALNLSRLLWWIQHAVQSSLSIFGWRFLDFLQSEAVKLSEWKLSLLVASGSPQDRSTNKFLPRHKRDF